MDDIELPEDLEEVEVIYSDSEPEEGEYTPAEDLAVLTFEKHKKSVFCSDLSKNGQLAVTGGEDDTAYVWHTENGEIIFECTGHKDSVVAVSFNFDNQLLATGDMAGVVKVWSVADKKMLWYFEADDIEWLFWHPKSNILFYGTIGGVVYIWQIPEGPCKVLPSPGISPTTCSKLLPNGRQILVGYGDGLVRLWNIKECTVEWSNSQCGSVVNMDLNEDGTLAIVAPDSMIVKMVDGRALPAPLLAAGHSSTEVALFNSDSGIVATGSLLGQLCVWELGHQILRHQASIDHPVTVMEWGWNGEIFVGATDGVVYVCNVNMGTLVRKITGHDADILSISVFKDGTKRILTTSDDNTAKIFNLEDQELNL